MSGERVLEQVRAWRDELLQLTRRNRLINYKKTKASTLEIIEPDAQTVVDRLFDRRGRGWGFAYPPEEDDDQEESAADDPESLFDSSELSHQEGPRAPDELRTSAATRSELSKVLHNLDRRAAQEFMDKGIRVLYVAAGRLHWSDVDEESLESPLILVPVELFRPTPRDPYRLRAAEGEPVLNPALAAKLEVDFELELEELDDEIVNVEEVLTSVKAITRKRRGWSVSADVVLSCFSFHKEAMYRDLLQNEAVIAGHPVVEALAAGGDAEDAFGFEPVSLEELDESCPPEEHLSILDADSTQRQCLDAARNGRSFVIHGPPGTGKSQTIANVIAELMRIGRSVLFVSEKAAALDVVNKRLQDAGLSSYVLELHSDKAKRRDVAEALGKAVRERPSGQKPLDESDLKRVRDRRRELSAYAAAMNEVREPFGRSLHWAIGRCRALDTDHAPMVAADVRADLDGAAFDELVELSHRLAAAWGPIDRGDEFLWRDLQDPERDRWRREEVEAQLEAVVESVRQLDQVVARAADELAMEPPSDTSGAERLRDIGCALEARPAGVSANWFVTDGLTNGVQRAEELRRATEDHSVHVGVLAARTATWRDIDVTACEALQASEATLSDRGLEAAYATDLTQDDLRTALESIGSLPEALDSVETAASPVANELSVGRASSELTVGRARELAEVARLADATSRPEPHWLEPHVVLAARESLSILRELVSEHESLSQRVAGVFTDAVRHLDVEALYPEGNAAPDLSRFSAKGRENRRRVQACARGKKLTPAVRDAIPLIRTWQSVRNRLASAELRHAGVLGESYYRRERSDFDRLSAAVEAAERVMDLLDEGERRRFGELVTPATPQPEGLVRGGQALDECLAVLDDLLSNVPEGWRDAIETEPLAGVAIELRQATSSAEEYLALTEAIARTVGDKATVGEIREAAERRRQVHRIEQEIAESSDEDHALIGVAYAGLETDFDTFGIAIDWARDLQSIVGESVSRTTAENLAAASVDAPALTETLDGYTKQLDEVLGRFSIAQSDRLRRDASVSFADALALVEQLSESIDDIEEWAEFVAVSDELVKRDLGPVLEHCRDRAVPREVVSACIEQAVLTGWISALLKQDQKRLAPFKGEDRESRVREFAELDARLRAHAAALTIRACNERRPTSDIGEPGKLLREAEKKRRHKPIRTLVAETAHTTTTIKPCFMMSPLAVSQCLPPVRLFDVVIFDEASQVQPCDAVNAIYRADQILVAGDHKQLPPTSFFDISSVEAGDEWEEDQLDEFESILDLCRGSGGLRTLPLLWHYRSQHESLITYSNYSFYEGSLVTYPGAVDQAPDVGVEFFHVPSGVYTRGGARDNPAEARAVVDRVLAHAERELQRPADERLTLGVVAFSEAQAARIEMELEAARRERPHLDDFFGGDRLHGFFVKNLENVQGDERDIITFSVGYGRDEHGKFTMNFGPINKDGGYRRLNVAITRARRRVEVVSSVTARDFSESANPGVRHLQRYLDYAERGLSALSISTADSGGDAESPFEEEVLRVIRSWGFDAVPQVGAAGYRIDIGVTHPEKPGQYVLGVECDGFAYHSSRVARDRDRLRQDVLEGLGWRLHRIWGTSWYRHRGDEEERLRSAIDDAVSGRQRAMRRVTKPALFVSDAVDRDVPEHDFAAAPDWVIPYRPQLPGRARVGSTWADEGAWGELRRMIKDIVAAEEPVQEETILERLKYAWDAGRVGDKMRREFDQAMKSLLREGDLIELGDGCFASRDIPFSEVPVRAPVDGDDSSERVTKVVPLIEIASAVFQLVGAAGRIAEAELVERTARLFGWERTGAHVRAKIEKGIDVAVHRGRFRRDGEFLTDKR